MSKESRRANRERLRQERIREQQRAKRNRLLATIGAAVAVVALVVGGGYLIMQASNRTSAEEYQGALAPQTLQEDGSVVMARDGAEAPVVEVYADYQCSHCARFELVNGENLKELAAEGEAIVHFRPVSIFADAGAPAGANSLRAAAAARAAADHGRFVEYNDLLFDHQPGMNQDGYTVEDLVAWGEEAGITDPAFAERVRSESEVVEEFVTSYYPELSTKAQAELPEDQLRTMRLSELIEWGEDNGVDSSFLDGSYVRTVLDATAAVNAKYSEGANAFGGTPSIYVNGELLGNETYSATDFREVVRSAPAGEVDTRPAVQDDSVTPSASPSSPPA
ncbi:thioredoxin domain-containing protein [Thermobifida alba]|uniref:Thioredoxin domain-containing protein n=1 Tax=Thermobifida alba TaxID=53522 RepID=A0ABY4L104_THEAE|nr:thioredoxin domain-containing protein [Thermobifida alba]UPT20013.1 thioredoxin domain-containing protein [Thermobifida alba]